MAASTPRTTIIVESKANSSSTKLSTAPMSYLKMQEHARAAQGSALGVDDAGQLGSSTFYGKSKTYTPSSQGSSKVKVHSSTPTSGNTPSTSITQPKSSFITQRRSKETSSASDPQVYTSKCAVILGLTKGCSVLSRTHVVAFDLLHNISPDTLDTDETISVGKTDGTVTIHKAGKYQMNLTGFAKSNTDITVEFHYPETNPDLMILATTHVPSVQGICLLTGISTTLSLRKGETVQLRVKSLENFTIGEGLRWEITEH